MIDIYRRFWQFLQQSVLALVLVAALIEGLVLIFPSNSNDVGVTIALLFFVYFMHRYFLFDEPLTMWKHRSVDGAPAARPVRFAFIALALIVIPVVAGLIASRYLLPADAPREAFIRWTILSTLPFYLLVLSMFGTSLSASVARQPGYRVSLGLRATFATMWPLVLGPGILGLVSLMLALLLARLQGAWPPLATPVGTFAVAVFLQCLSLANSALAVAVLCAMYRRVMDRAGAEPSPAPAAV